MITIMALASRTAENIGASMGASVGAAAVAKEAVA
jgi:hypothetical protein